MPAAAVIRGGSERYPDLLGLKGRRWMFKSVVKVCGSTVKLQLILDVLSAVEAGGIRGVAVKCLDITKNSDCEGSLLSCN